MAKEKKLVEDITPMSEDFAQWYTDVVKKADKLQTAFLNIKGRNKVIYKIFAEI